MPWKGLVSEAGAVGCFYRGAGLYGPWPPGLLFEEEAGN